MGILDDAIREHLDLKRRQGAAEDELARLEDEAFGFPTRPGDAEGAGQATRQAPPQGEAATGEQESLADAAAFQVDAADERGGAPDGAEAADAETGAPEAEDRIAVSSEPTVEHDTLAGGAESGDLELDIELDLEEEIEDVSELDVDEAEITEAVEAKPEPEPPAEEPPAEPPPAEPAAAAEEPIESLDTVEHHFEDALDEAEVVEEEDELSLEDSDEEDEDVLEETPEFLRDAPEDDELWFEQGEPKDFDF